MSEQPTDEKELLLQSDDEFHRLSDQHHRLDDRLHELTTRPYLSQPEQLEEVTLKKQKLMLKDRMEHILHQHRMQHAH
jgi:uncharacterized protein YdcH (DUF465 family)